MEEYKFRKDGYEYIIKGDSPENIRNIKKIKLINKGLVLSAILLFVFQFLTAGMITYTTTASFNGVEQLYKPVFIFMCCLLGFMSIMFLFILIHNLKEKKEIRRIENEHIKKYKEEDK